MILRSFAPRNESGSLRCTAHARFLPANDVDVSVFCAQPDSLDVGSRTSAGHDSTWRDLDEWKQVTRVPWPRSTSRLLSLRRFPLGSTLVRRRILNRNVNELYPALAKHIRETNPNVLFASCAPPETLLLARRASKEFGIPYITDLRDPWSMVSTCPYRHFVDYLFEKRLERQIHRNATRVIVAAGRAAELMENEYGVPVEKLVYVPNGFLDEELNETEPPAAVSDDQFLIVHAGELNEAGMNPTGMDRLKRALGLDYDPMHSDAGSRSPAHFLAAVQKLLTDEPELRSKLRVAFTGLKLDRLPRAITEFPFQECLLPYGRIPTPDAHGLMARADLLLLMVSNYFLRDSEYCVTIPAKTYTYLRFGKPILATIISTEMREFLSQFGGNRVTSPDDTDGIIAAIRTGIENHVPGESTGGLPPCPNLLAKYDRRATARQFAAVLHEVVAENNA